MRRSLIVGLASAGLLLGSIGVAQADHEDGDLPSGNNLHGMCTSSTRGSEQGQAKKRENSTAHGAFADQIGDYDGDGDQDGDDIRIFCGGGVVHDGADPGDEPDEVEGADPKYQDKEHPGKGNGKP